MNNNFEIALLQMYIIILNLQVIKCKLQVLST